MTYDLEVDHESHNFVANGIVTHNSQLSQRYVDESVAEYVLPPDIKNPESLELWKYSIQQSHDTYVRLVDTLIYQIMGNCPRCGAGSQVIQSAKYLCLNCLQIRLISTEQRKQARQAARSVLPNATETKLFMSMNARAARSIIELRCSRHADTEIRKVFYLVWKLLMQQAPSIFGDFKESELPDGTIELLPMYHKV